MSNENKESMESTPADKIEEDKTGYPKIPPINRASSDTRNYFHIEDLTRPGTDIPARNTISPRVAEPLPSPSTNIAKTHSQNYLSENANYPGRKLGIFRLILAGKERHMRLWTSTPRMIPPRTKILLSLGLMVIKLRESTSLLMLCPEAPELELLLIFLGMTANRQMQQQIELNLKARNLVYPSTSTS